MVRDDAPNAAKGRSDGELSVFMRRYALATTQAQKDRVAWEYSLSLSAYYDLGAWATRNGYPKELAIRTGLIRFIVITAAKKLRSSNTYKEKS